MAASSASTPSKGSACPLRAMFGCSPWTATKRMLAVLATLVALVVGLPMMLIGESQTDVKVEKVPALQHIYTMSAESIMDIPQIKTMINAGLKPYFLGLGLIFLMVALAIILADGQEDISTLTGRSTDIGE